MILELICSCNQRNVRCLAAATPRCLAATCWAFQIVLQREAEGGEVGNTVGAYTRLASSLILVLYLQYTLVSPTSCEAIFRIVYGRLETSKECFSQSPTF